MTVVFLCCSLQCRLSKLICVISVDSGGACSNDGGGIGGGGGGGAGRVMVVG